MAVMSFLFLFVILFTLTCVSLGLSIVLERHDLAPVRRVLAQWKHRWLAYAIPFGPAMMMLLPRTGGKGVAPMISEVAYFALPFFGLLGSAPLAACWLCIPEDADRPTKKLYVVLLSYVLWLLGVFAMRAVAAFAR